MEKQHVVLLPATLIKEVRRIIIALSESFDGVRDELSLFLSLCEQLKMISTSDWRYNVLLSKAAEHIPRAMSIIKELHTVANKSTPLIYNSAWELLIRETEKSLLNEKEGWVANNELYNIAGMFDSIYVTGKYGPYEAHMLDTGVSTWHQQAVLYFWCNYQYVPSLEATVAASSSSSKVVSVDTAFKKITSADAENNLNLLRKHKPFLTLDASEATEKLKNLWQNTTLVKEVAQAEIDSNSRLLYLTRISTSIPGALAVSYARGDKKSSEAPEVVHARFLVNQRHLYQKEIKTFRHAQKKRYALAGVKGVTYTVREIKDNVTSPEISQSARSYYSAGHVKKNPQGYYSSLQEPGPCYQCEVELNTMLLEDGTQHMFCSKDCRSLYWQKEVFSYWQK